MRFHCFFEQSGTFKNEFKKLGYEAYDYDILNDFGETDYVVDLFKDIEDAYTHTHTRTVFDNVQEGDQIIAFFPCTRFEDQIVMGFTGSMSQQQTWSDERKLMYDIDLHNDLNYLYVKLCQFVLVCIKRKIPLIIENPRGTLHYLNRYWSIKPKVIDMDRTLRGDTFKKPTQYWFINREPSNRLLFEPYYHVADRKIVEHMKGGNVQRNRSMIAPEYANRFIREFII